MALGVFGISIPLDGPVKLVTPVTHSANSGKTATLCRVQGTEARLCHHEELRSECEGQVEGQVRASSQ